MKAILISFLILFSNTVFAVVKVALIEIRDSQGRLQQLESGGRFAHVAISFQNLWLHAYPHRGVELVDLSSLKKIGTVIVVDLVTVPEISREQINKYLGKPYDAGFSWRDEGHYCSELVGKLLNIPPKPMSFATSIWNGRKTTAELGLSPDDIYNEIKQAGSCRQVF